MAAIVTLAEPFVYVSDSACEDSCMWNDRHIPFARSPLDACRGGKRKSPRTVRDGAAFPKTGSFTFVSLTAPQQSNKSVENTEPLRTRG